MKTPCSYRLSLVHNYWCYVIPVTATCSEINLCGAMGAIYLGLIPHQTVESSSWLILACDFLSLLPLGNTIPHQYTLTRSISAHILIGLSLPALDTQPARGLNIYTCILYYVIEHLSTNKHSLLNIYYQNCLLIFL